MITKITLSLDEPQYKALQTLFATCKQSLQTNITSIEESLQSVLQESEVVNLTSYLLDCQLQLALVNEVMCNIAQYPMLKEKKVIIPDA